MKRIFSVLAVVTLSLVGCGDDDNDDDNSNTGGTSAGTGNGNAGESTSPGGANDGAAGAPTGNVSCDASADGVCQNATDCPFVVNGEARQTAGSCGLSCLESESDTCAVDCIVDETSMTPECAGCYAAAVACATEKCLAECVGGPESVGCRTCQVEEGCREEFNTCSGLPE